MLKFVDVKTRNSFSVGLYSYFEIILPPAGLLILYSNKELSLVNEWHNAIYLTLEEKQ